MERKEDLKKVSGGLSIGGSVTAGKGVEVQDNTQVKQDNHTVETTTEIKITAI